MLKFKLDDLRASREDDLYCYLDNCYTDMYKLLDHAVIAGGALRTMLETNEEIVDVDLFFLKDNAAHNIYKVKTYLEDCEWVCVYECPLGYLTTYIKFSEYLKDANGKSKVLGKIQLITREYYDSLEHLVSTFDLAPCCAAMSSDELVCTKDFIKSVHKKNLYLNNLTYPVATLNRVSKYKQKGYYAGENFWKDVILNIQQQEFNGEQLALYID